MKIFLNWFWFLLFAGGFVALLWYRHSLPAFGSMNGAQVIFFALALAFTWVEVLKWGSVKPFNCIKCLTGWFALIWAFVLHLDFPVLYLPAGLFVGAMFEAIKLRWL